ncbi:hypothetical protein PCASD_15904 [Puccinia coronata f. sp. avenae]|uniref:Tc1-like transposase DDE domain-containing protein n=1 Tax=Puccinia coronata f. sp. avenae TaxID=200324 RepID=A0A2N5TA43_9BASI|nr:hypothetical protein PCASD_15904 [Puccinia coronata f. sp. avenae]
MSRSKASQGQVNRRRRERKQKEVQGSNVKRRKSKPKSKSTAAKAGKSDFPILIESDTDNDIQIMPTPTYKQINKEDSPIIILDDDEIFDFHENEIDEIDQANDIMQYTQAASDDSSENDDSESEDESSNMLWPVFQNHNKSTDQIARCRVVKSGRSGYQRPIENPNLSSLKLVPRPLPRATKHDRKVQRLKALGSNNNTMANWLSQARNSSSTLPKESKETAEGPQPIDDDETPAEDTRDPVTLRLIGIQQAYLLKKPIEPSEPNAPDPLPAWKELNEAIQSATTRFKERCKKDPKLKFPTTIIQSLTEFNNLRYKYSVEKTKAPGLSASLATAQSAIRRLPSLSGPQKSRSGLYLARNIMKQVRYVLDNKDILIIKNGNKTSHKSIINNPELRKDLFTWSASQKPGEVTPETFRSHVINHIFPNFKINKTLHCTTATRWMVKLGFTPQDYHKSLYFDGHERPDVILARKKYVDEFDSYRKRSRTYGGEKLDIRVQVDPEILGDMKETVFIFHDESTIHAKERPKQTTGRLKLTNDEYRQSQTQIGKKPTSSDAAEVIYPGANGDKWWDMAQLCSQVSNKAIPIFEALHPDTQAVFIFDCSSAHGAFAPLALRVQNMNLNPGGKQAVLRDTVIPSDDPRIPPHLHGRVQKFSYNPSHPDPTRAGKPKGVQAILQERGFWSYYTQKRREAKQPPLKFHCAECSLSNKKKDAITQSARLIQEAASNGYFLSEEQCVDELLENDSTNIDSNLADLGDTSSNNECCWSKILSQQSDFVNERPLLQSIIEDAGHVCLFLPKFHCELNPIELYWSYIKQAYRKESHICANFKESKVLFERIRQSCPITTIRKYFRRIDQQLSAYRQGYNGPQSAILMKKYTSHRCIPRDAAMRIDVLTS